MRVKSQMSRSKFGSGEKNRCETRPRYILSMYGLIMRHMVTVICAFVPSRRLCYMSSTELFFHISLPIYHHHALPLLYLMHFVLLISFKMFLFKFLVMVSFPSPHISVFIF